MGKKYYLGLDIGTDSVGWAVTDEHYNLIRKQGKHLWGARLFDEAKDASGRRAAREARRRLQRRRWRILMIQDIFREEMNKVDHSFFDRLNNSQLYIEDKPEHLQDHYLLFNDSGMTDKSFYKEYPTIYHLRKDMLDNPNKKFDIRQIYLVIAHMIKYRGNFLLDGELNGDIASNTETITDGFTQIDEALKNLSEEEINIAVFDCNAAKAKELIEAFKKESRKSILQEETQRIILGSIKPNALQKGILKLISGSKIKLKDIFQDYKDAEEGDTAIEFSNAEIDKTLITLSSILNDDENSIILAAKSIYDYRLLINLLKGQQSLTNAMVEMYETHQKQLKQLKGLFKKYKTKEEYNDFFRNAYHQENKDNGKIELKDNDNYVNYVGLTLKGKKKLRLPHKTSAESLYTQIKKIFELDALGKENFPYKEDEPAFKEIKDAIDSGTYLQRQNSKENGVLPYQLNKIELKKIIENQSKFYPFLAEKDKSYINPEKQEYKLVSILEFKIPYYVGPLSNKTGNSKNFWMERKTEGKITPWNFYDVIDEDATAKGFIDRMKNKCTYLIGEDTLPKNSLLYTEFMWLNEINNWNIKVGEAQKEYITKEEKNALFELYSSKSRIPSIKEIKAKISTLYNCKSDDISIETRTGKELVKEDMHASLKPFYDFKEFFDLRDSNNRNTIENIIYSLTMFEDKKIRYKKLKEAGLSNEQIKKIIKFNYKDWGKLSEKVLNVIKDKNSQKTLIQVMRDKPVNLMELLSAKKGDYSFMDEIDELNAKENPTREDLIDGLYTSPAMKRSVRQTMKIIDELKQILHIDHFDTFFVECTRREADKKRTSSRKKMIQDAYKAAKMTVQDEREYGVNISSLNEELSKKDDAQLRGKKLFLYFMQLGKSVYTGEPININRLNEDYDIDHIIPQAKLKDDSFKNIVLVEKSVNNKKSDTYPLTRGETGTLKPKGEKFVNYLSSVHKDLMPKEKANRILRKLELTDEELVGFVNRQLTMTDQSVKAVCDILRETEKDSNVVFSKASNVSDFRNTFDLVKCREINDFHHANDAYLNIVVGNVYNKVFTNNYTIHEFEEDLSKSRSLKIDPEHLFRRDCYALKAFGEVEPVWKSKKYHRNGNNLIEEENSEGTIDLVRKTLSWNDPMVTQMLRTQKGKSGFFNKISFKNKNEESAFPLKVKGPLSDTKKYGGYNDLTAPYFMLVKSKDKKGVEQYSFENIPEIYLRSMKTEQEKIEYLEQRCALRNPCIVMDKLLIRTIVEFPFDNSTIRLGITGRSGSMIIAINMIEAHNPPNEITKYLKRISKILGLSSTSKINITDYSIGLTENISYSHGPMSATNKENNIKCFEYLTNLFADSNMYKNTPEIGSKYINLCNEQSMKSFIGLTYVDQLKALAEVEKLLMCKKYKAGLSKYFKVGDATQIRFNKNMSGKFRIVKQSVTGFYEKKYEFN